MSIGVPTADSKSLLSGFIPAGAGGYLLIFRLLARLRGHARCWSGVGMERGRMGSALCPRCGNHMGLSLCVSEFQTSACQFSLRNTRVHPTGH